MLISIKIIKKCNYKLLQNGCKLISLEGSFFIIKTKNYWETFLKCHQYQRAFRVHKKKVPDIYDNINSFSPKISRFPWIRLILSQEYVESIRNEANVSRSSYIRKNHVLNYLTFSSSMKSSSSCEPFTFPSFSLIYWGKENSHQYQFNTYKFWVVETLKMPGRGTIYKNINN